MKEMRLFEIGFKEKAQHTGYEEKVNVAAENAREAEEKARAWVLEKHTEWWVEDGYDEEVEYRKENGEDTSLPAMDKAREDALDRVRNFLLAKLYDIGTLIV